MVKVEQVLGAAAAGAGIEAAARAMSTGSFNYNGIWAYFGGLAVGAIMTEVSKGSPLEPIADGVLDGSVAVFGRLLATWGQ